MSNQKKTTGFRFRSYSGGAHKRESSTAPVLERDSGVRSPESGLFKKRETLREVFDDLKFESGSLKFKDPPRRPKGQSVNHRFAVEPGLE